MLKSPTHSLLSCQLTIEWNQTIRRAGKCFKPRFTGLYGHSVAVRSAHNRPQRPQFTTEELAKARRDREKGLGPFVSLLPKKLIPYAELMRLEKPVGTWLLYLPCSWAILLAAMETGASPWAVTSTLGIFGAGALLMRGAGCTINDLADRKLDSQVIRSVERPIAARRVSVPAAVAFCAAQTIAGVGLLALLPPACWWLGLASLPIVATYPLFKRFTYYPQAVLSSCFNWGALLGFPAMGIMDWSTMLPLYAGTFLWCMTYDTIYAHQDKKFDINANIKSTALKWGDRSKPIMTMMSTAQITFMTIAGYNSGTLLGPGFIIGMMIFGKRLFSMINNVDLNNPQSCWDAFTGNIKTGLYFTVALLFDYILRLGGLL